jgi:ketosteroid isomerase-like protein
MATQGEDAAFRFADAISRCDREAALEVCHPDVESAWEHWKVEVEQTVEGADGRVAIVMTMHGRGKGSGATIAARAAHIWTLEEGKLRRNRLYREPELALRDLAR